MRGVSVSGFPAARLSQYGNDLSQLLVDRRIDQTKHKRVFLFGSLFDLLGDKPGGAWTYPTRHPMRRA